MADPGFPRWGAPIYNSAKILTENGMKFVPVLGASLASAKGYVVKKNGAEDVFHKEWDFVQLQRNRMPNFSRYHTAFS